MTDKIAKLKARQDKASEKRHAAESSWRQAGAPFAGKLWTAHRRTSAAEMDAYLACFDARHAS